ncbi:hypothetical protein ACX3PU_09965 [Chryseobacterium sp. A301]
MAASLLIIGIIAFVWLFPFFIILGSRRTTGTEKFAWILAVIFVSWFAWIFYLLLAPIGRRRQV